MALRYKAHIGEVSGADFKSQEGLPGEAEFLTSTNLPTYNYVLTKSSFNNAIFKVPLSSKDIFLIHYVKTPKINLSKFLGQEHISNL